jgi:hypothetical protein
VSARIQERDVSGRASHDSVQAVRCGARTRHIHDTGGGDLVAAGRGRAGRDCWTAQVKRCAAQVLDPPVARR